MMFFFFSSRRRHTRYWRDWSSDVCSSDLSADGSLGQRNDVVLAGLNHKMGYRGTTNTLLNFGEGVHTPGGRPGAVGHLVGEPHRGLTYMFHMMNEARIGVGMGATVLGYRSEERRV